MGVWGRSQGGCERRIEVFVKIQKKNWGRGRGSVVGFGGGGVRVDVNEKKKKLFLGGEVRSGRGGFGGRGRVGGSGWM